MECHSDLNGDVRPRLESAGRGLSRGEKRMLREWSFTPAEIAFLNALAEISELLNVSGSRLAGNCLSGVR
jgi:hypothetical protein